MTDRSMFDEDYDPADVVLPRMSRNRRVIGRLPTEPTGDDLMRDLDTYRRWNEGTHLDDDYPTTGEATDAHQRIFAAVPRLLALVAAQADQIAELRAALDVAETQANNHAEDAILLERAVKRVRALCREAEIATAASLGDAPYRARVLVADVLAALDGTEATP